MPAVKIYWQIQGTSIQGLLYWVSSSVLGRLHTGGTPFASVCSKLKLITPDAQLHCSAGGLTIRFTGVCGPNGHSQARSPLSPVVLLYLRLPGGKGF